MRAEVRPAVHEALAHDRAAAARARQPGLAVGVERLREVAGGAVDVHVLRVEARAALGEGLAEHEPHLGEQGRRARAAQRAGRLVVVHAGRPERLVGVDVADAADQGLVEQRALDRGVLLARARARKRRSSKSGSSGSRAMWATWLGMRWAGRVGASARARRAPSTRRCAGRRSRCGAGRRRDASRRARCGSAGRAARRGRAAAPARSCRGGRRSASSVAGEPHRQPEELAAPLRLVEASRPVSRATKSSRGPSCRRSERGSSTSTRSTVRAGRGGLRGRRARPRPRGVRASGSGPQRLGRWRTAQADSAAAISACFLLVPSPSAIASPASSTVAWNRFE